MRWFSPARRLGRAESARHLSPAILVALLVAIAALLGFNACNKDEPSKPDSAGELSVEAALVSSIIEQGDAATVTLFGTLPASDWSATHATARIVREPSSSASENATPGEVEVKVFGHAGHSSGQGAPGSFELATALPALSEGSWVLRVINPDGAVRETPFDVVPRGLWIRYRSFGASDAQDLDLAVSENGRAIVRAEGAPPVLPAQLTADQMQSLRSAFTSADFGTLEGSYLSDPPAAGRHIEIALRSGADRKHVIAEEALMPERLATLEATLHQFASELLASTPPVVALFGRIAIDPANAAPGTSRHITLTLVNDSDNEVTLHFANGLQFDLAIVRPTHGDMGDDDGDMGGDHGGMGGGMGGGMHGGMGGHGPEHAVIWQLSHLADPSPDPTTLTIASHGTVNFEADWNGSTEEGEVVGAGALECIGRVPATDRRLPVMPVRLHVLGQTNGLVASLTVEPRSAPPGTARTFTLTVTNPSDQSIEVQFQSTQRYEFAVDDPRIMAPGPGNIWLWSRGKGFADVVEQVTWQAHETKTFTETWDGRGNRGRPDEPGVVIPPGAYIGHAVLTAKDALGTMPVRIVVER